LLGDQERTIGGDRDRLLHVRWIELDERPARAEARIVDDDFRCAEAAVEGGEQFVDLSALARVTGERLRADVLGERFEIAGAAGGERDLDSFLRQRPRQRGGEAGARPDDQGGVEMGVGHVLASRIIAIMVDLSRGSDRVAMFHMIGSSMRSWWCGSADYRCWRFPPRDARDSLVSFVLEYVGWPPR